MSKKYLFAYDLGTSCIKASVMEAEKGILRSVTESYPLYTDGLGKAEQRAEDWWRAFCLATKRLIADTGVCRMEAVCVSGQMMVCLPIRDGEPLADAMIWADHRAEKEVRELEAAFPQGEYGRMTGMRASPNYTLPKIMYQKRTRPDIYDQAECYVSAKDFINLKLTGRLSTDEEDAAFTLAVELGQRAWSKRLLDAAGLDERKLPPIYPSGTVLGAVSALAALQSGIPAGTPVVLGLGDGGAATIGSGALHRGDAYTSLGTSSWVCAVTNQPMPDAQCRVSKIRYLDGYRDSGTMQAGGYSFSWLQRTLNLSYEEMTRQALQVPAGAGGLLFLPQLMGERAPFWNASLRGAFCGLTSSMSAPNLCRSVPEGVGIQLSVIINQICASNAGLRPPFMRLVGGGADSPLWRRILADTYGLTIITSDASAQAGALGIAVLAGVGVGVFDSCDAVLRFHQKETCTRPIEENVRRYEKLRPIFLEARCALERTDEALSAFQHEMEEKA